jgi:hypothetical protein
MGFFEEYLSAILSSFVNNNIIFVVIALILLQVIGFYINKIVPINIYQVATVMSIYAFINLPFTAYQMMMGGIVATFISYYVYNLFKYLNITNRIVLLNITTIISVISIMVLLNCVSMSGLAYTLMSYVSIPKSKINYLSSYIVGSIVIVILCALLQKIFNILNINILQKTNNSSQLQKNLSDWSIISNINKANSNIINTNTSNK